VQEYLDKSLGKKDQKQGSFFFPFLFFLPHSFQFLHYRKDVSSLHFDILSTALQTPPFDFDDVFLYQNLVFAK